MKPVPRMDEFRSDAATGLQDLLLQADDAEKFFQELAAFSASLLSPIGSRIYCNIMVLRRKKPITVVCSSPCARALDELQYSFEDGPCLTAMRTGTTIHIPDTREESRWHEYSQAVAAVGVGSILGVPLPLEGGSSAALSIYSSAPHGFTNEDIDRAELFAEQAAKSLMIELRLARAEGARENLHAAMKSRTAIDVAVGVIIAQNRCSQETALNILRRASNTRNIKLRDVALDVIASATTTPSLETHFDQ